MVLKDVLGYWKEFIGLVVVIGGTIVGVIAYADGKAEQVERKVQEELTLMKAQSALIHNDFYQSNRVSRKEIEIKEHQRELENLLEYIGDDEPTPRQSREVSYLDEEIARLRKEIEDIRVEQAAAHDSQ